MWSRRRGIRPRSSVRLLRAGTYGSFRALCCSQCRISAPNRHSPRVQDSRPVFVPRAKHLVLSGRFPGITPGTSRQGGEVMQFRIVSLCALSCVLSALWAGTAAAEPSSSAHVDADQTFSATQPGVPTAMHYEAKYHAAGDPSAPPPYMRRMTFSYPAG